MVGVNFKSLYQGEITLLSYRVYYLTEKLWKRRVG